MTFKAAPVSQNIDVHYFQTRTPGEWKARVSANSETFLFGPCSMRTLALTVAAFLRGEAAYTDALVHDLEVENE